MRFVSLVLIIGLAVAIQVWSALQWTANFDSDEAIFGLMALHTLQGHPPTYRYGIPYLGSVESLLSAGFMYLFGNSVLVFRVSTLLLFAIFLILHGILIHGLWGWQVTVISLLFLALPGWAILWWTFRPIGPYGVVFVLGTGALLLWRLRISSQKLRYAQLIALGILMGLGLWSQPMTIIYFCALGMAYWLQSPEWSALYEILARFCSDRIQIPLKELLPVGTLGMCGAIVTAFFSAACDPQPSFALAQQLSRLLLLVVAGSLALAFFLVSRRRRRVSWGALSLLGGFLVGNLPEWKAWLFFGVIPVTAILPSCPTDSLPRSRLIAEQLAPAMWGIPSLASIPHLSLSHTVLSVVMLAVMLASVGAFIWYGRTILWSLLALAPLARTDTKLLELGILFGLPLILAALGSNTMDLMSVRYLIISWQASSVIFALFLSHLTVRPRMLRGLILGVWFLQIVTGNLMFLGQRWQASSELYSPEAVSKLEGFMQQNGIIGGYADYWNAYTLDFLTEERLTIAPYNGVDRYPPYSTRLADVSSQVYLFPPGTISSQSSKIEDIIEELKQGRRAGPPFPERLDRLGGQVVLKRQTVANWDVWLVGDH
jgi:hypothetical protein